MVHRLQLTIRTRVGCYRVADINIVGRKALLVFFTVLPSRFAICMTERTKAIGRTTSVVSKIKWLYRGPGLRIRRSIWPYWHTLAIMNVTFFLPHLFLTQLHSARFLVDCLKFPLDPGLAIYMEIHRDQNTYPITISPPIYRSNLSGSRGELIVCGRQESVHGPAFCVGFPWERRFPELLVRYI